MKYVIRFIWDEEAQVWIATSDDVPGLVLESKSFDTLIDRVRLAVPELIELNSKKSDSIIIRFLAERLERFSLDGGV